MRRTWLFMQYKYALYPLLLSAAMLYLKFAFASPLGGLGSPLSIICMAGFTTYWEIPFHLCWPARCKQYDFARKSSILYTWTRIPKRAMRMIHDQSPEDLSLELPP